MTDADHPAIETPQSSPQLRLDQFLQLCGIAQTGGHAKILIQGSEVKVNGEIDTRRKRKLVLEDIIEFEGHTHTVNDYIQK